MSGTVFPDLTIVIPAKNEAASIAAAVAGAIPYAVSVMVVDGHSTDGTAELARAAGATVFPDGGKGKGEAIRSVIPRISTSLVLFMDADGSHDPRDIPKLVEPLRTGEADHVSGSRLLGGSSELHGGFDEFFRLAGSSFITACINRRFKVRLSDSQNGFRAIRLAVLKDLNLQENSTTIEQEMIMKTLRAGYRMMEVPAHEHARRHGRSHIRTGRVAWRYGYCLLKNLLRRTVPAGKGGGRHP